MPIRILSLIALVGCVAPSEVELDEGTAELAAAVVAAPTATSFILESTPFVAGTQVVLSIRGATPGEEILFGFSTAGVGDGPCADALSGRCLGILPPAELLQFRAIADVAGSANLGVNLPPFMAGRSLAIQAAIVGAQGGLSNVVTATVQDVGTGLTDDGDGDGYTLADGDCDDTDATIAPLAPDSVGDGLDANCDGSDGVDSDGDGTASIASGGEDCSDNDPSRSPTAYERCDGIDNDCDGTIDASGASLACGLVDTELLGGEVATDILFVVDDSCSMSEEQGRLGASFQSFLASALAATIDFHVGVITTDTDAPTAKGRLVEVNGDRWIDNATLDPGVVFDEMAHVGTLGSFDERGRRAASLALTGPASTGYNAGFLRESADLHIITLSDENDSSANNPTRNEWIRTLRNYKSLPFESTAHAITGPAGGCPTADAGVEYIAVVNALGGLSASICDADYTPFFDSLLDIVEQRSAPNEPYELSEIPDMSTLEVTITRVDGTIEVLTPADYIYDPYDNTVEVLIETFPGDELSVAYDR